MLAVDRDQLGAGRRPQRLHHRAGRDQALLVRQRQSLPGGQRGDGHRETGEADDTVHHDVRRLDECRQVVDDLGERQRGRDLGAPAGIGDGDEPRAELQSLGDQRLDRRPDAEPDHLVRVGVGSHDVEGLRSDRTRRAGDRDPDRRHVGDPTAIDTDRRRRQLVQGSRTIVR